MLNRYRVSFWGHEKVLEPGGDGCLTLMNVFSGTELYALKWLTLSISCHVYFAHNKHKGVPEPSRKH